MAHGLPRDYNTRVHPIVYAALAVVALSGVSFALATHFPSRNHASTTPSEATVAPSATLQTDLSSVCGAGQLADTVACVPIPSSLPVAASSGGSPLAPDEPRNAMITLQAELASHRDRSGQWLTYEQIPLQPDRPTDYYAYRYPTVPTGKIDDVYDLDRPNEMQRRSDTVAHVGHGGVDIIVARGTPIRAIRLAYQQGESRLVFAGKMFGNTVVTKHSLQEVGRTRDYLLIHGHLDQFSQTLRPSMTVQEGMILGYAGDSASEGRVHLHLEVRQVRDGVDPKLLSTARLRERSVSIVCDPRNVLPLK